jgi:hypothetical protein
MILECRRCQHPITVASLEAVFFLPIMVLVGMPIGGTQTLAASFGWWVWLPASVVLAPFLVMGGLVALGWWLLKGAVFLTSFRWACPACGARRWGWPRTGPVLLP